MLCEASLTNNNEFTNEYTNWGTMERTQSLRGKSGTQISHNRTQSLEQTPTRRPENLKLSGSSGPYIAISECYSGPRFNQYSPKHHSDNESVFTDDEWTHPVLPQNLSRSHLHSETALDADKFQWSHATKFSRVEAPAPPRPPKRPEPAEFVAPRDIPRSQQLPGHSRQGSLFDEHTNISPLDMKNIIASSTPNLLQNEAIGMLGSRTLPRQNCYMNATTPRMDGNIFRYDFFEVKFNRFN